MEVCPLSSQVILLLLNPYLHHYSVTFAFSIFLCLLSYGHPLRFGFPCGRTTGLPPLALNAAEGFHADTRVT